MGVLHSEETFKANDYCDLYGQWWLPEGEMKAMVIIVHGLAEHSGRYDHVAVALSEQGYGVGSYDQHGHGKSDPSGPKAVIDTFDALWDDLDRFMECARERAAGKPIFLFGHSMGGEVVVGYALDRQPEVKGLLVSAAAVQISSDISPILITVASVLSKIAPKMPTVVLDGTAISRDPAVVEKYDSDPLNYRGGVPARTGGEMNRIIKFIKANMEKITLPILIMHGTADRLADPQGSKDLYARVQSADKTLKLYEGFYHEILNEPEKDQVIADMVQWLDAHLN